MGLSHAAISVRPITLAQAKAHLRVDHAHEDDYITTLIEAASDHAAQWTGRSLTNTTWTLTLHSFPGDDYIQLPMPPLSSVTSVAYVDGDGATQTLATSVYTVDAAVEPGRIRLAYEQEWPDTRSQPNAVTIVYVGGYGASGSAVPAQIRQAVLLMLGAWYENREEVVTGVVATQIPLAASNLLDSMNTRGFAPCVAGD